MNESKEIGTGNLNSISLEDTESETERNSRIVREGSFIAKISSGVLIILSKDLAPIDRINGLRSSYPSEVLVTESGSISNVGYKGVQLIPLHLPNGGTLLPTPAPPHTQCLLPHDCLCVGLENGEILIINIGDIEIMENLKHGGCRIWSVHYDPGGDNIWSGGSDTRILLWDLGTLTLTREVMKHTSPVMGIQSMNSRVFTCACDNRVMEWDPKDLSLVRKMHMQYSPESLLISDDGKLLITANCGGYILVWDIINIEIISEFKVCEGCMAGAVLHQLSTSQFIAASADCNIFIFDITQKLVIKSYNASKSIYGLAKIS